MALCVIYDGATVRVFKSNRFHRFARKEKISDAMLCEAIERAERGLIDADLGAGLIRAETRAVFAFGFAKSDLANLEDDEEAAFKRAAKLVLGFSDAQMDAEVAAGRMLEVNCDG